MFEDTARLDTTQVEDRRSGYRPGVRTGAVGGTGLIVVVVVALLLGVDPSTLISTDGSYIDTFSDLQDRTVGGPRTGNAELAGECQTGADANAREDCRIVGFVNSVQKYWSDDFSRRDWDYTGARTRFFSSATQTGCGTASSQVGPFYCPPDQQVYIDLEFFDELLTRFGATGGPFAQAYVVAHEYGHHVQNLLGLLDQIGAGQGPQSDAVRSELQADCLAGVWAGNAVQTGYIRRLTDADVAEALDAATAVGDDRIQRQAQGRVNPESWTHGSSEQRQRWFSTGYREGDLEFCDTFRGPI